MEDFLTAGRDHGNDFPGIIERAMDKVSETAGYARAGQLLGWYDRHRRVLPWRALPGESPDPYRVWLSEIMLQRPRWRR